MKVRRVKKPTTTQPTQQPKRARRPPLSTDARQRAIEVKKAQVLRLVVGGSTFAVISREVGIPPNEVGDIVQRAIAEYKTGAAEAVERLCTKIEARSEAMVRAYWLEAVGGVLVDPDTNEKKVIPKNHRAAAIVQRADRNLIALVRAMIYGQQMSTPVTGGAIATSQVDEMEMARIMRSTFNNELAMPPLLPEVVDVPATE